MIVAVQDDDAGQVHAKTQAPQSGVVPYDEIYHELKTFHDRTLPYLQQRYQPGYVIPRKSFILLPLIFAGYATAFLGTGEFVRWEFCLSIAFLLGLAAFILFSDTNTPFKAQTYLFQNNKFDRWFYAIFRNLFSRSKSQLETAEKLEKRLHGLIVCLYGEDKKTRYVLDFSQLEQAAATLKKAILLAVESNKETPYNGFVQQYLPEHSFLLADDWLQQIEKRMPMQEVTQEVINEYVRIICSAYELFSKDRSAALSSLAAKGN